MDPDAAQPFLYLLQVANASFPTGAFNHSYGFETWIDGGEIADAAQHAAGTAAHPALHVVEFRK